MRRLRVSLSVRAELLLSAVLFLISVYAGVFCLLAGQWDLVGVAAFGAMGFFKTHTSFTYAASLLRVSGSKR